jgi:hypothetical protein
MLFLRPMARKIALTKPTLSYMGHSFIHRGSVKLVRDCYKAALQNAFYEFFCSL